MSDFLADFPAAFNRSQALDQKITQAAAAAGGQSYGDVFALATRQVYCGIEITIARDADGNVNASDVMAFYKVSTQSQHAKNAGSFRARIPGIRTTEAWMGSKMLFL